MGGIISGILGFIGGRRQAKALEGIAGRVDPYVQAGTGAIGRQADLLGVGGDPAASQAAFQNYLNSTGYQFQLGEGQRAVTGSAAARGLLNSGSTARRLTQYGQDLGSSYFNNYLTQLGGVSQQGLQGIGLQQGPLVDAAGSRAGGFGALATGIGAGVTNWLGGRRAATGGRPGVFGMTAV
ncbi:MAG: hypothetical protein WEC36_02630 [Phycisphaeraceae bacterium]